MSGDAGDKARAAKGRRLAVVIIVTALAFMGLEFAGATFGWSNRVMGLLEIGIAAIFVWVMIEAYGLWRSRQNK
ncbi:DUF5337 domain-containing protein [Litoreibacter arenae]|uniref:Uncharacterized protein n=1 Tax=Litoreibacter arenae DSM 19593 TaxID=1123360 RepID=S9QJD8_9RHOB|nr:DUF5337 domain-containing protein [Litoreibacter arenae]EPX79927.1 hypothetical protein thalar_01263 [Litoreibacter arenae DSM 19593]